jgi:hypothetical protein
MTVLVYVVGGVSIAAGALTAAHYLLSLTSWPAGHDRLRHWARISAAGKPHERRTAWNELGIRLGAVLTGTLLVLSVGDPAVARVSLIAVSALLAWQLVSAVAHRAQHRSAN